MTAAKFYKRQIITAEQFDGSVEMARRNNLRIMPSMQIDPYGDEDDPNNWSAAYFRIKTLEGFLRVNVGDWIATGVNGEHWPVADDIFRKTYQALPLIPEKVCELISAMKKKGYSLFQSESPTISIILLREPPKKSQQISQWVQGNQDIFALAWLLDDTEADND
jgi:hypothetical protein